MCHYRFLYEFPINNPRFRDTHSFSIFRYCWCGSLAHRIVSILIQLDLWRNALWICIWTRVERPVYFPFMSGKISCFSNVSMARERANARHFRLLLVLLVLVLFKFKMNPVRDRIWRSIIGGRIHWIEWAMWCKTIAKMCSILHWWSIHIFLDPICEYEEVKVS